jgi:hypothetical protein
MSPAHLWSASEPVESARLACDLDHEGKFLGTALVWAAAIGRAVTDPTRLIQVVIGQDFTLESNRTTGYQ